MKVLLLLSCLISCATSSYTLKFKIGECGYLVDPASGRGNKDDLVRVDSISKTHYNYRWMTYQGEWAVGVDNKTHKKFERLFKPIACPTGE